MTAEFAYEILFYIKANGECPIDGFLDSVPVKARAKIEKWLQLLEECGPDLPRPYADTVRDKIRELRVIFGSNQYRLLYFFFADKIILTHGFIKKSQKVPEEEIERAIRLMKDFQERSAESED